MSMATPPKTGDDKAGDEAPAATTSSAKSAVTTSTKPAAAGKPLIGRTAAVGIGIGSAALVAALLYASRSKPDKR